MIDDTELFTPWSLYFDRDGTEDMGVIADATGEELVRSRHFWLPDRDDLVPPTLASLRLMQEAPALRDALHGLLTVLAGVPITVLDGPDYQALHRARTVLRSLTPEHTTTPQKKTVAYRWPVPPIQIEVRGGVVQAVRNVPPGYQYEIRDYDDLEAGIHVGYRFKLVLATEAAPTLPWEVGPVVPADATGTVVALDQGVLAELDPPLPAAGCPTVQWATLDEFLVDTVPLPNDEPTVPPPASGLPADPDGRNDDRASWADQAMQAFVAATGTDRADMLCDLLADLMHWADRQSFSFAQELERATTHYAAETGIAHA